MQAKLLAVYICMFRCIHTRSSLYSIWRFEFWRINSTESVQVVCSSCWHTHTHTHTTILPWKYATIYYWVL